VRKIFRKLVELEEALDLLKSLAHHVKLDVIEVPLEQALNMVLAEDVVCMVDLPPFDRATMDGYAVRYEDIEGASEESPRPLKIIGSIEAGEWPRREVEKGTAMEISTGAPLPYGADTVVPVELSHRDEAKNLVYITKALRRGAYIQYSGSDLARGELLLPKGILLGPREIASLALAGVRKVKVYRRPVVAVITIGSELKEPGERLELGQIYDGNTYGIISSLKEWGAEPLFMGLIPDDELILEDLLREAISRADVVLTSGGTSAGAGDVTYRVVERLGKLYIHGINVKPGKPTLIGEIGGKTIIGLPGYPMSCLVMLHLLVRPFIDWIRGVKSPPSEVSVEAKLATRLHLDGRRSFIPVMLSIDKGLYLAYPLRTESAAFSSLLHADGFIDIPAGTILVKEGSMVKVKLIAPLRVHDLVFIGSHDIVVMEITRRLRDLAVLSVREIFMGSMTGLHAISCRACDVAGVHMLDPNTMEYNTPILKRLKVKNVLVIRGFIREQGLLVRKGNPKGIRGVEDLLRGDVRFVNRNKGSGTRALLDYFLNKLAEREGLSFQEVVRRIRGYEHEVRTHSAIALMIIRGMADTGLAIKPIADIYGLDFIPLAEEMYDFLVLKDRLDKPSVRAFLDMLRDKEFQREIISRYRGIKFLPETGEVVYEA